METKVEFGGEAQARIVYVRPVQAQDLPEGVRDQMGGTGTVYSVHTAEGQPLALVKDRKMAFVLARQHDMAPVHVH